MRNIYILLIVIFMFACKTTTKNLPKHFNIEKAYQQKWYGGQPGVEGTKYTLELIKVVEDDIQIDSLKIDSKWHDVKISGDNPILVRVNVNESVKPIEKQELDSVTLEKPLEVDIVIVKPEDDRSAVDSNVLAYSVKDKSYFLVVDKFDTHDAISYP